MERKHYFEKGDWRKATKEELIKYKSQFDKLSDELKGWCTMTEYRWIEECNSEGKDRLMILSRDDNGNHGVLNSCDIKLTNQ